MLIFVVFVMLEFELGDLIVKKFLRFYFGVLVFDKLWYVIGVFLYKDILVVEVFEKSKVKDVMSKLVYVVMSGANFV